MPESAVQELVNRMVGWLSPNGVCAIAEICNFRHMLIQPPADHLMPIIDALMIYIRGGCGCNPGIGNLLPGLLGKAGFRTELGVATKVV